MTRDYRTLDAILVVGSLGVVGGGVAGLMFVVVPSENLAVIAGLLGAVSGSILGGYAGFRWGASVNKSDPQPVEVTNSPADPVQTQEAKP